jgi:hypothetical protein
MGERIKVRGGEVWLDEKAGIVRVQTIPDTTYTLADAKEEIAAVIKVSGGKRLPLFVDLRSAYIDAEAGDYFASAESRAAWRAVAMWASTPQGGAVGAMWTAVYDHPDAPSRIYYSETDAVEWLRSFL